MINGIEGDEYGFTETHSDAGYSLLKKEVIVKVKETKADITPTEANITGSRVSLMQIPQQMMEFLMVRY